VSKLFILITHILLLVALPYWVFVAIFAPMMLTSETALYSVVVLLYLAPISSIFVCFILWHALWTRAYL